MPALSHFGAEYVRVPRALAEKAVRYAQFIEQQNERNRRTNQQGFRESYRGESLHRRVIGYFGEVALATYLGVPWSTRDDWRTVPDVGGTWEVRATDLREGSLILTPADTKHGARRYVLVIVWLDVRLARICGSYRAGDMLTESGRTAWWREYRTGGGAWYVPQARLASMPRAADCVVVGSAADDFSLLGEPPVQCACARCRARA